ncbi:MAG: CbtA family protein, partial [Acidimicrobiales bacterium]|nr:CbtA family protein [Acidimicrobiales bacterium]
MIDKLLHKVDPSRLRSLAVTAVVLGLLAGVVAAAFASVAGEPSIRDAIAIEEAAAANAPIDERTGHEPEEATVSRRDQSGPGLFGAYALSGAAFGALLALTSHGLRRGRPDLLRRIGLAGMILAGGFTVAPWLKYPPNPPAVGDPGTLTERQSYYVATICVGLIVGLGASILQRRLKEAGWLDHTRIPAVAVAVVVPMLVFFAAMPAAPDKVAVPATLV